MKKYLKAIIAAALLISCTIIEPSHEFEPKNHYPKFNFDAVADTAAVKELLFINGLDTLEMNSYVVFDNDGTVSEIHLTNRGIRYIPESIGKLKSLSILKLDSNQITSLPVSIISLTIKSTIPCHPVGGTGCFTYKNGLNLDYNFLCIIDVNIAMWITGHYSEWKKRQLCGLRI
jgi:hypothetical protein